MARLPRRLGPLVFSALLLAFLAPLALPSAGLRLAASLAMNRQARGWRSRVWG